MNNIRQLFRLTRKPHAVRKVFFQKMSSQTPRTKPDKTSTLRDGRYFLLAIPVTSMYLCYWQLQRREWKLALIDDLKKRTTAEPVPLPEDFNELKNMEYMPIKVEGEFDYSQEVYLGPRGDYEDAHFSPLGQNSRVSGVHVITPFKVAGKDLRILVNRGWYSNSRMIDQEFRKKGRVEGEIELIGTVRLDQKVDKISSFFMGDFNKPTVKNDDEVYLVRTIDVLAERLNTAPVFIESKNARKVKEAPQNAGDNLELRNTHMEYAATWFTLGMITFYMWAKQFHGTTSVSTIGNMVRKGKR